MKIGDPRQKRRPHRCSLKELSISGTDDDGDRSEVFGAEEIDLAGHGDDVGAKVKRRWCCQW